MQINSIQNKYDTNFGARLQIVGYTYDISPQLEKFWKEKAKAIGRDDDIIRIKFGLPSGPHSMIRGYKMQLHRMERQISAKVFLENGKKNFKNDIIGYKAFCKECSEDEFLKKSKNLTIKSVEKYFDKLKKKIRK